MSACRDIEPLFAPYVDGETQPAQSAAVEAHLRNCPQCRHHVADERAVHEAFVRCRSSFHASASPELRRRCESQQVVVTSGGAAAATRGAPAERGFVRRTWVPLSMAATLVLAVAGVFLYGLRDNAGALAAQLAVDHVKCFEFAPHPDVLPDASVVGREWAAARGWAIKIPATTQTEELELLGARRCLSTLGATAHLMYKWHGHPLSVYVLNRHAPHIGSDPKIIERLGQEAIIWSNGDRTYAVVAKGRPSEIEQIARFVRAATE
jgi:anti-sigma factor RsiW